MKNSLDYIKRKDKTLWGDRQLVTGWNCVAQSAYEEMMTTKRRYGKTDSQMFYQFVQSFSPEEDVTPEKVHAIDLCMRKARTNAEFLREMERRGYQVRWEDTRKYITYTTPRERSAGMTGCTMNDIERK